MARRSKDELIAEVHRVWDVFEVQLDFQETLPGEEDIRKHIPTREGGFALVDEGKITLSQLISGAREAINDFNEWALDWTHDPDGARVFLAFYKARTGRDYYEDAGNPKKLARAILKRGQISDEMEFRLLMGILNNLDQTVFKEKEIERVNDMLTRFEASI